MKITRKERMIQLTFLPHLFPVNCYLVEENEEVTLIDAALPYSAKGIVQAVRQTIGKPLTKIVLTHAHEDHIGALDQLKEQCPELSVYISARDSRLLEGDVSLDADEPQTPIRGGVATGVQTKPDILLADGDMVGSLQVVATPGHTPGSISLIDTRNRALIAGDAFQTRGGLRVSGILSYAFPFPALATWDKQTALASAKKLAALNPTLLAVGHGRMIDDPVGAINRAISQADKVLNTNTYSEVKDYGKEEQA